MGAGGAVMGEELKIAIDAASVAIAASESSTDRCSEGITEVTESAPVCGRWTGLSVYDFAIAVRFGTQS
jgi:hypothetical protein